jgi:hypothetical protein
MKAPLMRIGILLLLSFHSARADLGSNCAPSGLVGWWKGDGSTLDSVLGNNGVAQNIAYTNGIVGQAFAFDPNSYPYGTYTGVQIADSPAYVLTNSLTIEGWVRPRADGYVIFWRGDHRPGMDPYLLGLSANNNIKFQICDQAGNTVTVGTNLIYGQWVHVAATLEGSTGTMSIYINGMLADQIVTTIRPFGDLLPGQSPGVGIGNLNDGGNNFPFAGDIDEISLYNRALSASEIQAIYDAGAAGKCPPSPPPVISAQPGDQTVAAGGTATFTVGAQGASPLYWQWYFGASPLGGQTNSSLVLAGVQPSQAGFYSVVVSNAFGTVTSSNALLTVLTYPPTITTQPKDVTLYQGSNATFTVAASGTAPLSYQWFFNNSPMAGKVSPALTLTSVQPEQAGSYSVTVTNAYGTAFSSNAVLTVLPPPVCVPPPEGIVAWWRAESNTWDSVGINDLMMAGQSQVPIASFAYTAGKVGKAFLISSTYSYLWAPSSVELDLGRGAGLTIEGWIRLASSPTPSVFEQPLVEWLDSYGNVGAGLTLKPGAGSNVIAAILTDTNSPARRVVVQSAPYAITNSVWQHVALTFNRASGQTTVYVNGAPVAQTNLGTFTPMTQVPVTLGYSSSRIYPYGPIMDEISVYNRALTLAEIQSICQADYAGKCPPPPPACQPAPNGIVAWWQGQSNTLDCVDGNHAMMFPTNMPVPQGYATGMVNAGFWLRSGNYLVVPASPKIDLGTGPGLTIEAWINPSQFQPQPIVEWNTATGRLGANLTYTFSGRAGAMEADLVDTQGVSHKILTPANTVKSAAWQHVAVAYDKASGIATLFYNGRIAATTNLGSFTPRTDSSLYVGYRSPGSYSGSGSRFIGSIDEISLYSRALSADEIKGILRARTTGKCAEPPTIVTQPQSLVVNSGDMAGFSLTAAGTPNLHYQWYFNSNELAGASGPTLTLTNVQYAQAGNYWVVVTNFFGSAVSSNAVLRVNHPPVADAGATRPRVISCNDSNACVILDGSQSSDADGDALQYSWFVNGSTKASGTGVVAVVRLPLGTNAITLRVSDGLAASDAAVTVEVITRAESVRRLMARVADTVTRSRPLLATLSAALASIERGNDLAATLILQAFQAQVKAQVAPKDPALAQELTGAAQEISDALKRCWHRPGGGPGHRHEPIRPWLRHEHGKLHLEFPGSRGQGYLIEASSDLVHWEKIGVAKDRQDDTFEFEDAKSGQAPVRFYRVVEP